MFKTSQRRTKVRKPDTAIAPGKPKVLIVEDDANIVKIFSTVLELNGYEVITASYALPALFRVVRKRPDIILADLNMPTMNGFELLAQLKAHADTRDIPVVVVTGSAFPQDREAAFKAGCSGYIQKPVDTKKFLSQIAALLHDPGAGNMIASLPPTPRSAPKSAVTN